MSVYVSPCLCQGHDSVHTERIGPGAWWRQDANLEAYLSDQAVETCRDFLELKSEPTKGQVVLVDVFRVGEWSTDCTGLARV